MHTNRFHTKTIKITEIVVFSFVVIRFPFDWKTPFGYPVAWFSQFAGCLASFSVSLININFMVGSCWLFTFIADDITSDLPEFNRDDEMANKNQAEQLKRFCGIIQLYSDAKE